jgi:crossover junction endodeoxyribonuclease RusA
VAIHIQINGIEPAPQGSKRSLGNGRMIENCKRVKPWREAVRQEAIKTEVDLIPCACNVSIVFRFLRPRSHFKKDGTLKQSAPKWLITRRGDVDKLLRSTFDGLTGALLVDDSLVVTVSAEKRYCVGNELPGASICVMPLD